jgi:hypothetical protein
MDCYNFRGIDMNRIQEIVNQAIRLEIEAETQRLLYQRVLREKTQFLNKNVLYEDDVDPCFLHVYNNLYYVIEVDEEERVITSIKRINKLS